MIDWYYWALFQHHTIMIKWQNSSVAVYLVEFYVKGLEQVEHMIFVKADLMQSAEFYFHSLSAEFFIEAR